MMEDLQKRYKEFRMTHKMQPLGPGEVYLPSLEPVEIFPEGDEAAQWEALKQSPQMAMFAEYRARAKDDRWNPSYHYYSPDGRINDPNGLCFWNGRYHLFYQNDPARDPRPHWGHAISEDLVRWQDLPRAIYPGDGEYAVYSGGTLVEDDRVIAMYHGRWAGSCIAVSKDPLLLNWEKSPANPVIPLLPDHATNGGRPYAIFDPFLWKEGKDYFSLSGAAYGNHEKRGKDHRNEMAVHLFHSQDLESWAYMGDLSPGGYPQMPLGNDGACPYFVPVGERYALFNFSHESGPHVFIGDYDKVTHRFTPDRLQKLNFGPLGNSSYQAPCALADGEGGVYLVLNTKDGDRTLERDGAMSLVYRMTLGEDGLPRYRPVEAIQSLRKECREMEPQILPAFEEKMLDVRGRAMDIELQLRRRSAHSVRLRLLRSDDGREHTDILLHMPGKRRPNIAYLTVDLTEASLSPTVQGRVPASTQFDLADDEPLNMRILLDRCMLEVFVNDRVVLMQMMYPTLADSDGVSIQALGGEMELTSAKFWQMGSIYESSNITEVP